MIFSAATGHGIFFKSSPAGRRLARVEDLRARSANGFNETRSQRRNPRKPLDKIQRDTFGTQNRACRARNFHQDSSGDNPLPVVRIFFDFDFRRKFAERDFRKSNSRDDERLARPHDGFGRRVCRNGCQSCRVAAADVLGERGADGGVDFCGGQFHAAKMDANQNAEKQNSGRFEKMIKIVMACSDGLV